MSTPAETPMTPNPIDPGPGWRLLAKGETPTAGDDFWSGIESRWMPAYFVDEKCGDGWYATHYRRRITPQPACEGQSAPPCGLIGRKQCGCIAAVDISPAPDRGEMEGCGLTVVEMPRTQAKDIWNNQAHECHMHSQQPAPEPQTAGDAAGLAERILDAILFNVEHCVIESKYEDAMQAVKEIIRAEFAPMEARVAGLESLIRAHVEASNNDDSAGDTFRALQAALQQTEKEEL